MKTHHRPLPAFWRRLPRALAVVTLLTASVFAQGAASTGGRITGVVNDADTRNFLQGALVEIAALHAQALTDSTGRFAFEAVPPGDYAVSISYVGLPRTTRQITVASVTTARLEVELRSDIYKMAAFTVTGEREGMAASITQQRNAPNVKAVVDMDAFGNMPNQNAGEVLIRLAGIAPILNNEGLVTGVMVRGAPSDLSTLSVDGKLQADSVGLGRGPRFANTPGSLFGEIEVTKGSTPDMPAESIGGAINLKTRTPLAMKEKRRFAYRVGAKVVPSFVDAIPMRHERPAHPITSMSYQELFDAFGGSRNFGVSLDVFYSENVSGYYQVIQEYQNTVNSPAYVYDFQSLETYNHRTQQGVSLKLDYRLTEHTRLYLNAVYNDALEPFFRSRFSRAGTAQTVAVRNADGSLGATGNILPEYTDKLTPVRGIAGTAVNSFFSTTAQLISLLARGRQIGVGAVHEFPRWQLDYNLDHNRNFGSIGTGVRHGNAGGGVVGMQLNNLGYIFDKSASTDYPRITQTSGPSLYDPASYTLPGTFTQRNNRRLSQVTQATANLKYKLPTSFAASLKTGLFFREQQVQERNRDRIWRYRNTAPLARLVDPSIFTAIEEHNGYRFPQLSAGLVATDAIHDHPEYWTEDVYTNTVTQYRNKRGVTEALSAAYVQGQAKLGRFGVLTGVRAERAVIDGVGYVLVAGAASTAAQRTADPVGAALSDWNHPQAISGDYRGTYPSVHLTYDLALGLKARASWSNTVGRPGFTNLFPSYSASDPNRSVTINNPALKPQRAATTDAVLEYYFEPVGLFSVGFFKKRIQDYIVTIEAGTVPLGASNGYDGQYEGYQIFTRGNSGFGEVQGWEISYQQQFSFLPGALKGLSGFANLTTLTTRGNYGGSTVTTKLAGFVPKTGNVGLNFRYRKFGARGLVNYTGTTLTNPSTNPAAERFQYERKVVNLSLSYDLHPRVTLFLDGANLFNEPIRYYRYLESRQQQSTITGTAFTAGVSGRF
ncbi:MAG: TonB-dependent receptor [Verrucomicrobia bacterium]|nr:TonB-dependent receptor [Verrucomicrobiota bacterium]